jgi:ATP-dependent Clp protease ATP-binding subunit ClpC
MQREWREKSKEIDGVVDEEVIAEVVSKMTGVPLQRSRRRRPTACSSSRRSCTRRSSARTRRSRPISKAIRRARAGLKDPKRPMGSFIFVGPSGVGKTLLSKALAEFMFGDEDALSPRHERVHGEAQRLAVWSARLPGTSATRRAASSPSDPPSAVLAVVLLDEVEKAHPDVFNMLLQIMEEGRLTDSFGRNVDFRNVILIMTSNIGADLIKGGGGFGFQKRSSRGRLRQHQVDADEGDRAVLPPRVHQPPR